MKKSSHPSENPFLFFFIHFDSLLFSSIFHDCSSIRFDISSSVGTVITRFRHGPGMSIHSVPTAIPYDSNVYLLKGERNVLIDTATGIDSGRMISNIRALLGGRGLDMVILTHCHGDHIGGLRDVMREFGSEAFALPPDSEHIRNNDDRYILGSLLGVSHGPVEVTDLSPGQIIDIGDHRLRVIPTPGHTAGGICLYDEVTHSLFSGDTLFLDGVGRTDFPSGSFQSLRQSLMTISNIDIRGLYPGHGNCSEQYGSDYVRKGLRLVGDLS